MEESHPWQAELEVAILAVQHAALIGQSLVKATDKGSVEKDDLSPVTVADFAIQAMLTHTVRNAFPNDILIGEENADALREGEVLLDRVWAAYNSALPRQGLQGTGSASHPPFVKAFASKEELCCLLDICGSNTPSSTARTWIFDPIDGTKSFVRGELYAINVALLQNGKQVLSVVGCPNLSMHHLLYGPRQPLLNSTVDPEGKGCIIFGSLGWGAWVRPLQLDPAQPGQEAEAPRQIGRGGGLNGPNGTDKTTPDTLRQVTCLVAAADSGVEHVHSAVARELNMAYPGSDLVSWVLRWVALACGVADVTMWAYRSRARRGKIWDHAGAMLLFEEAGGRITDLDGWAIDLAAGRHMTANYGFVAAPEGLHARVLAKAREVMGREAAARALLLGSLDPEGELVVARKGLARAELQLGSLDGVSAGREVLQGVLVRDLAAARERLEAAERAVGAAADMN